MPGPQNLVKLNQERFSLKFGPDFCPKLGEDQKKKVFTQIWSCWSKTWRRPPRPGPGYDVPPEHRRSQDFWLGGAQTLKNSAVFTEIESEFWAEIGNSNDFSAQNQVISKKKKKKKKKVFTEIKSDFSAENQVISKKKKKKRSSPKLRVVFRPKPLALLLLYCLITVMCAITEKKLQLNIVRLCCHNFLSLVEFWLGGARAPWAPPPWLRLCPWTPLSQALWPGGERAWRSTLSPNIRYSD